MNNKKPVRRIQVVLGCVFRRTQTQSADSPPLENSPSSYQVLLARRKEKQLPEIDNKWELPGGKVELNEAPRRTAIRELLEETGYLIDAVSPLDLVYSVVRDYPDYKQETYITCYECELISDEKFPTRSDSKIGEVSWFNIEDVDYFKTLAGSREFLFHLAKKNGVKLESTHQKVVSYAVFQVPLFDDENYKSKQASKRRGRKYVVNIQLEPDLSNYYLITYRRGINRRGWTPKIEIFSDNETMLSKARERISLRFQHGYVLSQYDNDFPLLDWIKKRGFPIKLSNQDNSPSQLMLPIFRSKDFSE